MPGILILALLIIVLYATYRLMVFISACAQIVLLVFLSHLPKRDKKSKKPIPVHDQIVFYHDGKGYTNPELVKDGYTFMEPNGPSPAGWYFWDETGAIGGGPYKTEKICRDEVDRYCEEVLGCMPAQKK